MAGDRPSPRSHGQAAPRTGLCVPRGPIHGLGARTLVSLTQTRELPSLLPVPVCPRGRDPPVCGEKALSGPRPRQQATQKGRHRSGRAATPGKGDGRLHRPWVWELGSQGQNRTRDPARTPHKAQPRGAEARLRQAEGPPVSGQGEGSHASTKGDSPVAAQARGGRCPGHSRERKCRRPGDQRGRPRPPRPRLTRPMPRAARAPAGGGPGQGAGRWTPRGQVQTRPPWVAPVEAHGSPWKRGRTETP